MRTKSYCNHCAREIPAEILTSDGHVVMVKRCPEHGFQRGTVERDPAFYGAIKSGDQGLIYNGLFVDVTNQCNLNCRYCYHDNTGEHVAHRELKAIAGKYKHLAPFFLTGGEPTVHTEFFEILSMFRDHAPTVLVTNGTKTADKAFCKELVPMLDYGFDSLALGLSYHKEAGNALADTLANLRELRKKAGTVLFVIDSLDEVDEYVQFFRDNQAAVAEIRLKVATKLWNEPHGADLYISDIVKHLKGCWIDQSKPNKTSFVNIVYDDMDIKLVAWYHRGNVDLNDIDCAPYYIARDGSLNNLVTSCIKNEVLCK